MNLDRDHDPRPGRIAPTRRDLVRLAGGASLVAAWWTVLLALDRTFQSPTEARHASPVVAPSAADVPGSLPAMLGLAPESLLAASPAPWPLATFSDYARQLTALGLSAPGGEPKAESRWYQAIRGFALPAISDLASTEAWQDAFGWTIYEADQSFEFVDGGEGVLVLRGRFDPASIRQALTRSAYQEIAAEGTTIYSLFPDRDFDQNNPASLLMFGSLNNIALRDDGTLVGTGSLDSLERALAVADGTVPSLADRPEAATLLSAIEEPFATAALLHGASLDWPAQTAYEEFLDNSNVPPDLATEIAEQREASANRPQMPPTKLALLGMTAGGPFDDPHPDESITTPIAAVPDAAIRAYVLFGSVGEADAAVPIFEERLDRGSSFALMMPWSAVFERRLVRAAPGLPVVLLDLGGGAARAQWYSLLVQRDLSILGW